MALLAMPQTAMPFHSENSFCLDGPSSLSSLPVKLLLIIQGTSQMPCPLRSFLESPDRINCSFFWQSLMEHLCWCLEIQRWTRRETVIVLWGQKCYLINYHTLLIFPTRKLSLSWKNIRIDGLIEGYEMETNNSKFSRKNLMLVNWIARLNHRSVCQSSSLRQWLRMWALELYHLVQIPALLLIDY